MAVADIEVTESLADALETIYIEHGKLTPELVVEAARDPDSPLHGKFEWNNGACGEAYRLWQARVLSRRVTVMLAVVNGSSVLVRAFVNIRENSHRVYLPVRVVMASEPKRTSALDLLVRRLKSYLPDIEMYPELKTVARAIRAVNL